MDPYLSLISRLALPFILTYSLLERIIYPLTLYVPFYLMKLINYQALIFTPYLITFNNYIRFSTACAAISAFFLLLILIVLTQKIRFWTRVKMFLLGSLIIFGINMIRILFLIYILETHGFNTFQQAHDIIWLVFGSILVAFTWIYLIRKYHIKDIPIISDLTYLLKQINIFKSMNISSK